MGELGALKPLIWIGSSKRELMAFPEDVIHAMGLALMRIQYGDTPPTVKPLRGFGGGGVLEVIEDDEGGTYRVVYSVRFKGRVYVLHAFKKKSKRGVATPKPEIDLVRRRLRWAAELHAEWEKQHGEEKNH